MLLLLLLLLLLLGRGSGRGCLSFGLKIHSPLFERGSLCFVRNSVLCRMCRWYTTDHEFDITRFESGPSIEDRVYRF
jgi:hypothetical protein